MAVSGRNGSIILCWADSGELMRELYGQGGLSCPSFSHDSKLLACASDDFLYIWKVHTGKCVHAIFAQGEIVDDILFSATSPFIASCHRTGSIGLWNYETGVCFQKLALAGPLSSAEFSPDSTCIVSASEGKGGEGIIQVCRVTTGDCVQTIIHNVAPLKAVISPDLALIAGLC